jgi:23S rRNA G2445 N2-methylase RlmL
MEAAAARRGGGSSSAFAFERWPDHDPAMLASCLEQAAEVGANARRLGAKPILLGNDMHRFRSKFLNHHP